MDTLTLNIRDRLLAVAGAKVTIGYKELTDWLGIDPQLRPWRAELLYHALDTINRNEHNAGRPLLSAVVIVRESGMPGDGFFRLAKDLTQFNPATSSERDFWEQELRRLYDYWAPPTP